MKNRDILGAVIWAAVGAVFCIGATDFGFSRMGTIGGGFFPFIAGAAMIGLSVILLITTLAGKREGPPAEPFLPERDSLRKLSFALLALFAYVLVVRYGGFVPTTFLFMTFLLRFIEPQRWVVALGAGAMTTGAAHLVFNLWLKVQLPRGFLGI
jgi:putative tricarboxylic transport membrane protein